jgi:hypothetical protein
LLNTPAAPSFKYCLQGHFIFQVGSRRPDSESTQYCQNRWLSVASIYNYMLDKAPNAFRA